MVELTSNQESYVQYYDALTSAQGSSRLGESLSPSRGRSGSTNLESGDRSISRQQKVICEVLPDR